MIYADHAATTPMCQVAKGVFVNTVEECFGNPSAVYGVGQKAKQVLEMARDGIARMIDASPDEIFFTSGGTEADNQAIRSAAQFGKEQGKCHIVTTAFEHHAVLHTLEQLEKEGFEVTYLSIPESGVISVEDVEQALREETCLVVCMYANNEIGTIQPIKEIGALCKERQVLFFSDAVQVVGHLPISVRELGVDYLSASAHKFYGPKGVGFLYVKKGAPHVSVLQGGAQEKGFRPGTENVPGIAAMEAALRESLQLAEAENESLRKKRNRLLEGLLEIPDTVLNGEKERRLPGNVNLCFAGVTGDLLLAMLDARGICASSGSACASGSLDPSHVLLAMGRDYELARGALRLSIGPEITEDEIESLIVTIQELVGNIRG